MTFLFLLEDDVITVKTPAFAESVTEGDVRWEKGKVFVPLPSQSPFPAYPHGPTSSAGQLPPLHLHVALGLRERDLGTRKQKGAPTDQQPLVVFSAVGDTVAEDEVVCEIETDKVGLTCVNANFVWSSLSLLT